MRRITINLASQPLRNRRLFFSLAGLLSFLCLVFIALAAVVFIRFFIKGRSAKVELAKTETAISTAQREERQLVAKVRQAVKKDQKKVDLLNSIVLKKSFSWAELLSKLEECLPDSSYVIDLAPTLVEDTRVQFRIKVVSRNVDDLVALVNNFLARGFSDPRVENEERNEKGLSSEISVSYDRHI